MACSVIFATREPASARGSISVRRAEMSANSAPTLNVAFARSGFTEQEIDAAIEAGASPAVARGFADVLEEE